MRGGPAHVRWQSPGSPFAHEAVDEWVGVALWPDGYRTGRRTARLVSRFRHDPAPAQAGERRALPPRDPASVRAAVASWWGAEFAGYDLPADNRWLTRLLASLHVLVDTRRPLAIGDAWGAWRTYLGFVPRPGGNLDAWLQLGWLAAAQAADEVRSAVLEAHTAPTLGAARETVARALGGYAGIPGYPLDEWDGAHPVRRRDGGGKARTVYAWGAVSPAAAARRADRGVRMALRARGGGPASQPDMPAYRELAGRLLRTAVAALRVSAHVTWQLEGWVRRSHESAAGAAAEAAALAAPLKPLADVPAHALAGLLHDAAGRCRLEPAALHGAEQLLEAAWHANATAAFAAAWGVAEGAPDEPRRCGPTFPAAYPPPVPPRDTLPWERP